MYPSNLTASLMAFLCWFLWHTKLQRCVRFKQNNENIGRIYPLENIFHVIQTCDANHKYIYIVTIDITHRDIQGSTREGQRQCGNHIKHSSHYTTHWGNWLVGKLGAAQKMLEIMQNVVKWHEIITTQDRKAILCFLLMHFHCCISDACFSQLCQEKTSLYTILALTATSIWPRYYVLLQTLNQHIALWVQKCPPTRKLLVGGFNPSKKK